MLAASRQAKIAVMERVFNCGSPRGNYRSDAAVVWCFDSRFQGGFSDYLEERGLRNLDIIKIAGGAKSLATPERETDREFVVRQVLTSIRLHKTPRVFLTAHSDCGAYGGLAAFGGDAKAEMERQEAELKSAANYLKEAIPEIEVEAFFVDFEGVWEVALGRPVATAATP